MSQQKIKYNVESKDDLVFLAKWALSDKKVLSDIASALKKTEYRVKSILKDPKFANKVETDEPESCQVFNIISQLKCKEEFVESEEYEEVYGENSDDEMYEFIESVLNDSETLSQLVAFLKKTRFYVKRILKDKEFTKKVKMRNPEYTTVFDAIIFIKAKQEYTKKPSKNVVAQKEVACDLEKSQKTTDDPSTVTESPKFKMNASVPIQTGSGQINFIYRKK